MRTLVLIALLVPQACAAAERGWYVFLEGGLPRTTAVMSRQANDAELTAEGFTVIASNESNGETSVAIGAGYQISNHLALELSYVDLGQLHLYNGTVTQGVNSGNRSKEWEGSAFGGAMIGSLPLRAGFSLLGKVAAYRVSGAYRMKTLILAPPPAPAGTIVLQTSDSASGSGALPAVGVGVSYRALDNIEIRAMYELWRDKPGLFGAGNDLERMRIFFLGASYRF